MPRRNSILGCIVGGAVGDAAGAAFEGSGAHSPDSTSWFDHPWRITDDTQLTLATCEALSTGRTDPAIVADYLLRCFRTKRVYGIGSSTLKALRDLSAGCHWALAGCKGDRAAGNGAAMRIAPLAFCIDPTTPGGRHLIRDISRITHHNEEAYIGALATVLAIKFSMVPPLLPLLDRVASNLPDSVVRDRLMNLAVSEETMSIEDAGRLNGTSGFVAESVPVAIFASQQALKIGITETLAQIIKIGGDTDTIASIACQVAGAALGFEHFPNELVERLPEKEMILGVANRFADAFPNDPASA